MGKVQESIEVNVPVRTAYDQWTQFEEFPKFMEGVKSVEQVDDRTLQWHASIAGNDETWTAEITDQEPDKKVAWRSTSGAANSGAVTFEAIGENTTKVTLEMEWTPSGVVQRAGDALGFDDRRVKGDLDRFKEFIESRGEETGAWRGEIKANTSS